MIAVDALGKSFAGRAVLDGVSLRADRGEVVCLVGPSGGGKSTLLRCLIGLETFDRGSITVGEATLRAGAADATALGEIRKRIGLVFQQWHLFAHLSVTDNVTLAPIHVRGAAPSEAGSRAQTLLDRVGLGHRARAFPHQLSGGEQQRAAIARALAMQPEVLLLDEPTSALDPERVGDLVQILRGLAAEGMTLLIVTHDDRFATQVASRTITLRDGRVVG